MTHAVLGGERSKRRAVRVTCTDQLPCRCSDPRTGDSIATTRGLGSRMIGGVHREEDRQERIHHGGAIPVASARCI